MNDLYTPIDVTDEQRANLQRLADYLLTNTVDDFDMVTFRSEGGTMRSAITIRRYDPQHDCGSVGCAIGHGPQAGIEPRPSDWSWITYSGRAFGVEITDEESAVGPLWSWCFDDDWAMTDNSARGAGKRIQIALNRGIPDNHEDQRLGYAGLSYTP